MDAGATGVVKFAPGEAFEYDKDGNRRAQIRFDDLLKTYLSLGDNAGTIVRKLRKRPTLILAANSFGELRSLDRKRLELLDQMEQSGEIITGSVRTHRGVAGFLMARNVSSGLDGSFAGFGNR